MITSPGAENLLSAMLQKQLFVVLRTLKDEDRFQEHLQSHLEWMIDAEKKGHIFASGPVVNSINNSYPLAGLTLLRSNSISDAREIVKDDPFIKEGVFSFEIYEWRVMEGKVTIDLNFHNKSFDLH